MVRFVGGPADGAKMPLSRCPVFLRIARSVYGAVDALECHKDCLRPGETGHIYVLQAPAHSFRQIEDPAVMNSRGRRFVTVTWTGEYKFLPVDVPRKLIRAQPQWDQWCEQNHAEHCPGWARKVFVRQGCMPVGIG